MSAQVMPPGNPTGPVADDPLAPVAGVSSETVSLDLSGAVEAKADVDTEINEGPSPALRPRPHPLDRPEA